MRNLSAVALVLSLAGCQKSDIQNCVDAHLEAYDAGSRAQSDNSEKRYEFKARIHLVCGQAIGSTKIDAQIS